MKAEKQFALIEDVYGVLYYLNCLDDKDTKLFVREELTFLGVPENVIEAAGKGPVTFKLTFERL